MTETITRQSFIYDFMTKTSRPVVELDSFLNAFDKCVAEVISQTAPGQNEVKEQETPEPVKDKPIQMVDFRPQDVVKEEEQPKPKRKYTKPLIPVVHSGTTMNVHPRAKMVEIEFLGRTSYYGSITAAAQALNASNKQVEYAIKNKKQLFGYNVRVIDQSEIFRGNRKDS